MRAAYALMLLVLCGCASPNEALLAHYAALQLQLHRVAGGVNGPPALCAIDRTARRVRLVACPRKQPWAT
jgi:hypothetical protein